MTTPAWPQISPPRDPTPPVNLMDVAGIEFEDGTHQSTAGGGGGGNVKTVKVTYDHTNLPIAQGFPITALNTVT